jgi:hypothetical protein
VYSFCFRVVATETKEKKVKLCKKEERTGSYEREKMVLKSGQSEKNRRLICGLNSESDSEFLRITSELYVISYGDVGQKGHQNDQPTLCAVHHTCYLWLAQQLATHNVTNTEK